MLNVIIKDEAYPVYSIWPLDNESDASAGEPVVDIPEDVEKRYYEAKAKYRAVQKELAAIYKAATGDTGR
jgi:hypothetical protein